MVNIAAIATVLNIIKLQENIMFIFFNLVSTVREIQASKQD